VVSTDVRRPLDLGDLGAGDAARPPFLLGVGLRPAWLVEAAAGAAGVRLAAGVRPPRGVLAVGAGLLLRAIPDDDVALTGCGDMVRRRVTDDAGYALIGPRDRNSARLKTHAMTPYTATYWNKGEMRPRAMLTLGGKWAFTTNSSMRLSSSKTTVQTTATVCTVRSADCLVLYVCQRKPSMEACCR